MRKAIPVAAALWFAAAVASAQPAREPSPSIVGAWAFETGVFGAGGDGRGGCRISGTMSITRAPSGAGYACSFTATERCASGLVIRADQSCTATRDGATVTITSKVDRVSPANISYAPDHWKLIVRGADLMTGELRSADTATATFRRGPAIIS